MPVPVESIGGIAALLGGLVRAFRFVQEGEQGCVLRFGRARRHKRGPNKGKPIVIHPGFVLLIPLLDRLQTHHVRQQAHKLESQTIMIADGLIFNFGAVIIFRVTDIYKALFEIDNLDASIVSLCEGILRDILATKQHDDLDQIEQISEELFKELTDKTQEWGVEFIQFRLTECAPTPETAAIVNVSAGVQARVAALQEVAESLSTNVENMPPSLAAALVGVPLVTSVSEGLSSPRQGLPSGSAVNRGSEDDE